MESEWVRFLEQFVLGEQVGVQEQLARICLDDCITHNELTNYQAHRVWMRFLDGRGFS